MTLLGFGSAASFITAVNKLSADAVITKARETAKSDAGEINRDPALGSALGAGLAKAPPKLGDSHEFRGEAAAVVADGLGTDPSFAANFSGDVAEDLKENEGLLTAVSRKLEPQLEASNDFRKTLSADVSERLSDDDGFLGATRTEVATRLLADHGLRAQVASESNATRYATAGIYPMGERHLALD